MNRRALIGISLLLVIASIIAVIINHRNRTSEPLTAPLAPEWSLTFSEEFNGSSLDPSKWNRDDPWNQVRNEELQAYVPDAFELTGGILRIRVDERDAHYDGALRDYSSGIITTYKKFSQRYGRFEIRCRVPAGNGFWPAFWLLPDPRGWPPEIDVMEILGENPSEVHLTHHWLVSAEEETTDQNGTGWTGPDFSEDFHIFSVDWSPEAIIWKVDGVERFRSKKEIPHQPMYMLVNLALGGTWPVPPDETTPFPAYFDVDYVRAFARRAP